MGILPKHFAPIDSSISMVKAVARYLQGKDFPALGLPRFLERVVPALNLLPPRARERVYTLMAGAAAVEPEDLGRVDAERFAAWVAGRYSRERRHQAVLIGAPNGAAVHLAAALDAPYLTQTFLLPVRQRAGHPDDVIRRAEGAMPGGRRLLEANPKLQIHQLHDPVNDRPQLHRIDYFRVKYLDLPSAYERLVTDVLEPGGTIVVVDCRHRWPATRLQERHLFQLGGIGGVSIAEYHEGSERVEGFLERYGSRFRRWDVPPPDGHVPESEWGYEPSLDDSIERLARERGYRIVRLVFEEAEDLGAPVAELYRWWYRERGVPDRRLIGECFFLLDPWWTLRTGSVPYWMIFNSERAVSRLQDYLDGTEAFDQIGVMLLSNAVDAIGNARIESCEAAFSRARESGGFVGVDPDSYPLDMAALTRYRTGFEAMTDVRLPMPSPLSIEWVGEFLSDRGRPAVCWAA